MLIMAAIKIVQEYEWGVIFRLGRLVGARGSGLFFIIPGLEAMRKATCASSPSTFLAETPRAPSRA
jgi:regulator of protease activity HflC (stomatin/prohibitin superfamily)